MLYVTKYMSDKLAITLSTACALHCLLVPSFLIVTSGFFTLSIHNELIHYALLSLAVPISLIGLYSGHKKHNEPSFFYIGITGLAILISAVFIGEIIFNNFGEEILSVMGSIIVVYAHFRNYQTCKEIDCSCHAEI